MTPAITESNSTRTEGDDSTTRALPYGLYTEITLYARNANWFGTIDILSIGSADIMIEDIKTGKAKDVDHEQLRTYAWLWWRDNKRNPNGRLPTQLRIQYLDSSVEVSALDESELVEFELDLLNRTARAVASIAEGVPEARPDVDICRYCEVRQLCDTYWSDVVPSGTEVASRHGDVEVELIGILSRKTWQVKIGVGSSLAPGVKALLRGPLPESLAREGSTIRVLNALFVEPPDDQPPDEMPVIQLLAQSELFVRPLPVEAA